MSTLSFTCNGRRRLNWVYTSQPLNQVSFEAKIATAWFSTRVRMRHEQATTRWHSHYYTCLDIPPCSLRRADHSTLR